MKRNKKNHTYFFLSEVVCNVLIQQSNASWTSIKETWWQQKKLLRHKCEPAPNFYLAHFQKSQKAIKSFYSFQTSVRHSDTIERMNKWVPQFQFFRSFQFTWLAPPTPPILWHCLRGIAASVVVLSGWRQKRIFEIYPTTSRGARFCPRLFLRLKAAELLASKMQSTFP